MSAKVANACSTDFNLTEFPIAEYDFFSLAKVGRHFEKCNRQG